MISRPLNKTSLLRLSLLALNGALAATAVSASPAGKPTQAKRPVIDVAFDERGRFERARTTLTVDAPPDVVWATLLDFKAYPSFMPRVEDAEPRRRKGKLEVDFELDTPLVTTEYTSRYDIKPDRYVVDIRVIDGDNEGSRFRYRLVALDGGKRTRLSYGGRLENFSTVVEALDDDAQTVTLGVNTALQLATVRAITAEAEKRHRARPTPVAGGRKLGRAGTTSVPAG
jgi:ribosome-associated toxin RatA of RatAB toxin-antitoxin module